MPVLLDRPTATTHAYGHESLAQYVDRTKGELVSDLSAAVLDVVEVSARHSLPATMLQPVSYHPGPPERLRIVEMEPVDESLDVW